jgi:predicted N-formylglutamate amidohydrolase
MPVSTDTLPLLSATDPAPVLAHGLDRVENPFIVLCDHAGNAVPSQLGTLGLEKADLDRHIGIDINAWDHATALADALGVPAIGQAYSRLVIDCNRRLDAHDSIPVQSDGIIIPANRVLTAEMANARWREIMQPYHASIGRQLARMPRETCIIAMHTCTSALKGGTFRPWHIGIIAHQDRRIADSLLGYFAERETGYVIGDNEPYRINPVTDYTLPVHAEGGGRPYVEFELRNDLFATPETRGEVVGVLADALTLAMERLAR